MEGLQLTWWELPQSLGLPVFHQGNGHETYERIPSEEEESDVLVPDFDSDKRKLSMFVATLSLSATLAGGGLVMVPVVFEQCGIMWATILIAFFAVITERSLVLLCKCARRAGVGTMADVVKSSFGIYVAAGTSGLLFVFLFFIVISDMVFLRNAWTPVVVLFRPGTSDKVVLLALMIVGASSISWRELISLRRVCYTWLFAALLTCGSFGYLTFVRGTLPREAPQHEQVLSAAQSVVRSIPYIAMTFCGSINALQVQAALRRPTRKRIGIVIGFAVLVCFVATYIIGLTGYLFFNGNFLLSVTSTMFSSRLALVGSVGFGLMIFLSFPFVLYPCRQNLLEFLDKAWLEHDENACGPCRRMCPEFCEECCDEDPDAQTCMTFPSFSSWSSGSRSSDAVIGVPDEGSRLLPPIEEERFRRCNIQNNMLVHYSSTLALVTVGYGIAVLVVDISLAWCFAGSSVALLVSYALAAACYIQIQERDPDQSHRMAWMALSWFLILTCVVAFIARTLQTLVPPVQGLVVQLFKFSFERFSPDTTEGQIH